MNKIKSDQNFPEMLESCNISSIFKNRGSRNDLDNYRGIFRVPILRSILDRLIYNDEYETIDESLTDSNVGARKGRNIRDNLFVLYAVCNSVINGKEEAIDVQVFDVQKCFDALWMEECMNDTFESGLKNDKLPLLYLANQRAKIAVKMSEKLSKRTEIENVVMQGTVWGSLLCTSTMEKLGKYFYDNEGLLYKYKGKVGIPCIGMVDDLLCVQRCGNDSIKANAVINAFVETKKLTLGKSKSHRLHIEPGRKTKKACTDLKVHNEVMDTTENEKYLGDLITSNGKIDKTIEDRRNKGYAMTLQIMALLDEIPLGRHKIEIGLLLRKVMLINCMLFNSEVWNCLNEKHMKILEKIDECLLRRLLGAHSKTPLEMLYLETGALPIRFIISLRRLLYLHTILNRSEDELTKKIYKAQKECPTKGDFCELVAEDLELIGLDESTLSNLSKTACKKVVKASINEKALAYLHELQKSHTKVSEIKYNKLCTQSYLNSPLFSDIEARLLFKIRTGYIECKSNFKHMYKDKSTKCSICQKHEDDQKHIVECINIRDKLRSTGILRENILHEDIYSDNIQRQKAITVVYKECLEIRGTLIKNLLDTQDLSTLMSAGG